MKRIVAPALIAAGLGLGAAALAQPTPTTGTATPTPAARSANQDLLKSCNDQASARKLTGDAQRGFLNTCLAGNAPTFAPTPGASTSSAKPAASGR